MASVNFINECKNGADGNRLGKINVEGIETSITNADNLQKITFDNGCYVDGSIIGTTYSKKVIADFIAIPNEMNLIDKIMHLKIGVKYADLSDEYINIGKYTVSRPKDEQTANKLQITAYDDFALLDEPYACNINFEELDNEGNLITRYISDFYIDLCSQLELAPKTTTFLNSDVPVSGNPFTNKESIRIVLQEIEKVACSFSEIDFDTNEIDLVWLSQSEAPDYEFDTGDYSTLEGGSIVYGPVNSLVIKDSQIEGENVTREDQTSITENGETQITIEDSYFLYTEELRALAIDNIWNRVKGLTYTDCKLTTYYGKPFLKCGMKIRVNVNDGRVFDTYILKHTFTYDGTFESVIESPALTKQETKIKNTQDIKSYFRKVERTTNKIDGKLEDTIEQVDGQGEKLNQTISTVENTTSTVSSVVKQNESITETMSQLQQTTEKLDLNFKKIGGINLLSNSSFQNEFNDWSEGLLKPYVESETEPSSGATNYWIIKNSPLTPTIYYYTTQHGWKSLTESPVTDEVKEKLTKNNNSFYYSGLVDLPDSNSKYGVQLNSETSTDAPLPVYNNESQHRVLIHKPFPITPTQKEFNLSFRMLGHKNYGKVKVTVYFLNGTFENYQNDLTSDECYMDHIVQENSFTLDAIKDYSTNILLNEVANEMMIKIEYENELVTNILTDGATPSTWYSTTEGELIYFDDGDSGERPIYQSVFQDGKATYIESETEPTTYQETVYWYNPMDDIVYKPIWKNRKVSAIESEWYTEYEVTDLTTKQIDDGITIRYFESFQNIGKTSLDLDDFNYLSFDGNIQFYEIMISDGTDNTEWQPKNGENYWDKNFKFGSDGMKITNEITGETRIIDVDDDVAYDKNNTIRWQLTPTGGLFNDLEVKGKITQGKMVIVPKNDGNAIYFVD